MATLHGVNGSPFVRKVRVALAEKGIEYEQEQVMPFKQSEEYLKKSPLGKIPCWEENGYVLPDSSCILAYLERAHPSPALYPADPQQFGRVLWYEEYGDSKLVENAGTVFFQRVVRPMFFQEETDQEAVRKALEEDLPPIFGYLEGEVGDREFLVGDGFTIADIGIASPLVNFMHAGEDVDASRWPKLSAYLGRIHSRPSFAPIIEAERAAFSRQA